MVFQLTELQSTTSTFVRIQLTGIPNNQTLLHFEISGDRI